ncbi:hypothetical protein SFRURICE_010207 [Spodoptera frugiperda]|uniref:SFRICE_023365 n=1 Tax=Spodoptera frugiperda TaxID=7108 RepID=A0A2H1WSR4_SPOFR|nr:hypothetical protein SFRURICE_015253 [Spodoptera frugiperda]KAF9818606.1 hypothetical protein SFRURICE_010207 [Spodoptera frugiperda]
MNSLFYLTVFAICLVANCGTIFAVPAPSEAQKDVVSNPLSSYHRIVREAHANPSPMILKESMFADSFSRKRREAKGGGSMPTRKG